MSVPGHRTPDRRTPDRRTPNRRAPDQRALRRVTDQAIRRLGMVQTLILAGAAVAALAGGALAAFLAGSAFGWPFRPVWAAASLIFFVAPGLATWAARARSAGGRRATDPHSGPAARRARAKSPTPK